MRRRRKEAKTSNLSDVKKKPLKNYLEDILYRLAYDVLESEPDFSEITTRVVVARIILEYLIKVRGEEDYASALSELGLIEDYSADLDKILSQATAIASIEDKDDDSEEDEESDE